MCSCAVSFLFDSLLLLIFFSCVLFGRFFLCSLNFCASPFLIGAVDGSRTKYCVAFARALAQSLALSLLYENDLNVCIYFLIYNNINGLLRALILKQHRNCAPRLFLIILRASSSALSLCAPRTQNCIFNFWNFVISSVSILWDQSLRCEKSGKRRRQRPPRPMQFNIVCTQSLVIITYVQFQRSFGNRIKTKNEQTNNEKENINDCIRQPIFCLYNDLIR